MAIYAKLNASTNLAIGYGNLANIFKAIDELAKAEEYADKAVKLGLTMKNNLVLTNDLINRGVIYSYIHRCGEAITDYTEATKLTRKTQSDFSLVTALLDLEDVNLKMLRFNVIKNYFGEVLKISKRKEDQNSIAVAMQEMSIYYLNHNQADSACPDGYRE